MLDAYTIGLLVFGELAIVCCGVIASWIVYNHFKQDDEIANGGGRLW